MVEAVPPVRWDGPGPLSARRLGRRSSPATIRSVRHWVAGVAWFLRAVLFEAFLDRFRSRSLGVSLERLARSAAVPAQVWAQILSRIHLPRTTGDVRLANDVTERIAPLPSNPKRFWSSSFDPAEFVSGDVRNAVVFGQPFVEEVKSAFNNPVTLRSSCMKCRKESVSRRMDWNRLGSKSGKRRVRDCNSFRFRS